MIDAKIDIDGKDVKAKIWDTAGQERFRTITKSFYQRAKGLILTYDITNKQTYEKLDEWMTTINESADPHVVKFLVGNKSDLEPDREVSTEEGAAVGVKYNMNFYETSAKLNINVNEAFVEIIKKIHSVSKEFPNRSSIVINTQAQNQPKKCC